MAVIKSELRAGSTNRLRLIGMQADDGSYPADAVVIGAVYDNATGAMIQDAIAMAYVAGSVGVNAEYRGTLPSTAALVVGTSYKIVAVAQLGTDVRRYVKVVPAKE